MSLFKNILEKILVLPTIIERVKKPAEGTKRSTSVINAILDPLNVFRKSKAQIDAASLAKKESKASVRDVEAAEAPVLTLGTTAITKNMLYIAGAAVGMLVLLLVFKKRGGRK